ncbi:MAG: hypothetical protein HGB17_04240, partial [Syntrophobacteraceae bacterium]|nr:hypothetical protein [Syntrophobacteraceae bacterium]
MAVWVIVQCFLTTTPLTTRSLPPEVDDSLAFLVRTQVLEECFFQDCPALEDLRKQRELAVSDPKVLRAHDLSSFPFPFYHPFFSILILMTKALVGDLAKAYRILWIASPLFFGTAFACLLAAFWGKRAAGVTLAILAFKVFPDTGLHYFTPANLAMGLAVLMWARIIVRRGDAPWALIGGSIAAILTHPIGGVYVLMTVALCLTIPREGSRRRLSWTVFCVFAILLVAALLASTIKRPAVLNILGNLPAFPSPTQIISACVSNLEGIFAGVSRLKESLLGQPALLLLGATTGFFLSPPATKQLFIRFALVYSVFLVCSLLHTH